MATHNIVVFGGDHCGPEVCAPIFAAIGIVSAMCDGETVVRRKGKERKKVG